MLDMCFFIVFFFFNSHPDLTLSVRPRSPLIPSTDKVNVWWWDFSHMFSSRSRTTQRWWVVSLDSPPVWTFEVLYGLKNKSCNNIQLKIGLGISPMSYLFLEIGLGSVIGNDRRCCARQCCRIGQRSRCDFVARQKHWEFFIWQWFLLCNLKQ